MHILSWDVLATPSLECHTELLRPCQFARVLKPSVQYMFSPMCILLASVSHSLPLSVSSQISETRGKGMAEHGCERHCLMVTAPSDCSVCPSVLMSQQPGQLQHPLGTGPHLSSHSYNFPKLDKVSIREGYVGKMTCISEIWSKVVCVERERKSLVNHQPQDSAAAVQSYQHDMVGVALKCQEVLLSPLLTEYSK